MIPTTKSAHGKDESEGSKFKVLIQFSDGECGEIEATPSQTLRAFKESAERSYGALSVTAKWTFEAMELEEKKQLCEYGIGEGSIVVAQMQVYVYFLRGKGFLLDVDPSVTVVEMKAMVESKIPRFSVSNQRILLEGNNLDNIMTLSQCGVADNANLFVLVRDESFAPPKDGCMQIYVRADEKIHALNVLPTDNVLSLKNALLEKEQVIPGNQRLSFGGRDLDDDSLELWQYGVNSECMLHLVRGQKDVHGSAMEAKRGDKKRDRDIAVDGVGANGCSGAGKPDGFSGVITNASFCTNTSSSSHVLTAHSEDDVSTNSSSSQGSFESMLATLAMPNEYFERAGAKILVRMDNSDLIVTSSGMTRFGDEGEDQLLVLDGDEKYDWVSFNDILGEVDRSEVDLDEEIPNSTQMEVDAGKFLILDGDKRFIIEGGDLNQRAVPSVDSGDLRMLLFCPLSSKKPSYFALNSPPALTFSSNFHLAAQ
ncbi:hypothetical protein ACHAWF_019053 [Thalassiosira exigua]